ncbi:MAG: hypothetical protein ACI9VR_002272 [Cognaticolwellia sp.]|jgi:hypothetical protein
MIWLLTIVGAASVASATVASAAVASAAVASAAVASAAVARAPDSHTRVSESLEAYALERCQADSVALDALGLAWSVDPEVGHSLQWSGDVCRENPVLYLSVFSQGKLSGRYSLRPVLQVERWGLIATQPATRGQVLQTEDALVAVWTSMSAVAEGKAIATRSVAAGEPVNLNNAAFGAERLAGDPVLLSVTRGSVSLVTDGELMADAALGERVPVKNLQSGQVVEGVLGPNGRVFIY